MIEHLSRAEKAQRILDNGCVHPVNAQSGRWNVDSESRDLVFHVNVLQGDCDCEDHQRGNHCKHLIAAEKAMEIYNRPAHVETPKTLDAFIEWATTPALQGV